MTSMARRDLLKASVGLAALGAWPVRAAMGPGDKFDLLLRNASA